jgi:hypothetical protein
MTKGTPWTRAQNLALLQARIRDISWEAISEDCGRTANSCKQQVQALMRMPQYADLTAQLEGRTNCLHSKRGNVTENLPRALVDDRDRRTALRYVREETDATATFFGDPLPGYSALDRRSSP